MSEGPEIRRDPDGGEPPAADGERSGDRAETRSRPRFGWRVAKTTVRTLVGITLGLVLVSAFLLRTALGNRVVLGWGLDQLRARVAGTVTVDEIRSANLLRGVRLVGVRLVTPEGELFVEADSLEASYSVGGLLRGTLAFEGIRVWNPRVALRRDSTGDDTFDRWLRGDRPPEPGGGGGPSVLLEAIGIEGGSFSLRLPTTADPDGLFRVETGEDGLSRRALDLRGIQAQVARVELSPEVGVEVEVGRASAEVDLLERRFPLTELRADVRLLDGRVAVELRRFVAPGVEGGGSVDIDLTAEGGAVTDLDLRLERADLAEWSWVADGVPALDGTMELQGHLEPDLQRWTATDVDARWSGGGVRGRATAILSSGVSFEDVALTVAGLPLAALEPYLPRPLEAEGALTGRLTLSGPADRLRVDGQMELTTPDDRRLEALFEGGIRRRPGGVGFEGFRATLDPLDWGVLGRFVPGLKLTGPGRMTLEASGSWSEGLAVTADLRHAPPGVAASRVMVSGNVFAAGDDRIRVDVQGDLAPLSLDGLALDFGALPISGTLTGPWRARGVLRDLEVRADLDTPEGTVAIAGRLDVRNPGAHYRLEASVDDFLASALSPAFPAPTRVTGRVAVDGRGLEPATLEATAQVDVVSADVRGIRVDSALARVRIGAGVVTLDTLRAAVAGFALRGEGTLAADTALPSGRLVLAFEGDDLTGIRAIFRGDTVLTADDLTPLDRDVLVLRGVDPDTLPMAEDVVAEGRLQGEVVLEGSVRRFGATGWIAGQDLQYGQTRIQAGRIDLDVRELPGLAGALHADLSVDSVVVADRTFTGGTVRLDYTRPEGRAVVELARDSTEEYRLTGRFELDSLGGVVDLEEATIRIDSLRYRTAHPTRVTWTDSVFAVDSLELVGVGADPVRIRAAGTLPRRGTADFDVEIRGLGLQRLARVAQREDLQLSGTVDFTGSVRGTAARPRVEGTLAARDLEAGNLGLERLEGRVEYADLDVELGLDAWARGMRVLRVEGVWPASLTLDGSTRDVSQRPVDLRIRADSLPAGLVLSLLEDLEDTRGAVTGELTVGGTSAALEPRGRFRLAGGAWTVGALGVRQEQVEATFDVQADRIVQVQATGRSGGTVDVTGTVSLDTLSSPGLDLDISLASFQAVDRRDIAGAVSGRLDLVGSYGAPRVLGSLQVERGDLYLDEFSRNVGVVDLSDPRFFAFIDEDLLASRPFLAETRNPFMDNLLVNIDLAVARNTWLRSTQLNVEMRGDLIVTYDRRSRDIVMIGELEAVRGQYQFLGQSFEVQGGSVEFVGIPGINPNMSIQAQARVRRRQGEPLTIDAEVGGTLIEPRVELTTPDAAVSESDILSYIAVGQPASSLTSQPGSALLGGGVSFIGGTLTSSLSSLAQSSGWIDFLSISQAVDATALGANAQGIGRSFAGTQVELGRYFGGDYFAAVMFRPLYAAGGTGSLLGGARIEWQASEQYSLELFAEDRFLRTGSFGFREFGIESSLIFGFSLYREWGY